MQPTSARKPSLQRAFTLVELSIVLVILALLIGGMIAGKALIRAAELRATVAQITEFTSAVAIFRSQYAGLPGDIVNATNYWGGATSNGNGNGLIEAASSIGWGNLSNPDSNYYDGERPQFFKQLSLAGLVSTTYDGSGTLGAGYPQVKLRPNMGMFATGAFDASNYASYPGAAYTTDSTYMYYGICNPAQFPGNNSYFNDGCGVFKPEEAEYIDQKIDDGNGFSGKVIAITGTATCSNADGSYYVIGTATTCQLMVSLVPPG